MFVPWPARLLKGMGAVALLRVPSVDGERVGHGGVYALLSCGRLALEEAHEAIELDGKPLEKIGGFEFVGRCELDGSDGLAVLGVGDRPRGSSRRVFAAELVDFDLLFDGSAECEYARGCVCVGEGEVHEFIGPIDAGRLGKPMPAEE